MARRLFIKINRSNLPQVSNKYPFIYLERGRLEIDDSSIKWIDSEGNLVRIPVATIHTILLGPGTSITHEAVKVMTAANCTVCWVGEDSLLFYAVGQTPTSDTRNLRVQMELAANLKKRTDVARRMFQLRFPNEDISEKSVQELMGMEGKRVKKLYEEKAAIYSVGWKGRSYIPGKFELSDITNQILTSANAALYGILTSAIISLGYSPHIGFVHSGSPLPFVYDVADLYKETVCIDLAFSVTRDLAGMYNKHRVSEEFRNRIIELDILGNVARDIKYVLGK
ncbi:type I-E CRISPR-associated endonuclease Cas1e [Parasphaerochaeta coccoides]|uniref:CRISPR-associated endonuclease Cas1 n=1 Tax=Parasphaerochaeta coccoides (strain ATCC BAA-1237 / DSM 17374 / SPN1) TaxID=760011 RepID=F4GL12_PARC1|nr:type I-E CRISPR-associated endonuclease Cas1e [Parasphaerochaeta coccoides]AEC02352.1 CRISPR-associated protein, Cas1 family [Parasphaerochaeta coccoides DSM 17374]